MSEGNQQNQQDPRELQESKEASKTAGEPAGPPIEGGDPESLDAIDAFLAVEDPEFVTSVSDIKSVSTEPSIGVEIDSLDVDELMSNGFATRPPGPIGRLWQPLSRSLRSAGARLYEYLFFVGGISWSLSVQFFKWIVRTVKKVVLGAARYALSVAKEFKAMGWLSRLKVLCILFLFIGFAYVVNSTFSGGLLRRSINKDFRGFSEVADKRFQYEADEPMENFNNPILYPENVVLVEKIVVNLRRSRSSMSPMALIELYIDTATRQVAVEIKDRDVEVRDVVRSILEQMTYEELATPEGKTKVKIILRKKFNEILTKGRVRRIYFKTVVLKP